MKKLFAKMAQRIMRSHSLVLDKDSTIRYKGEEYKIIAMTNDVVPGTNVSTLVIRAHSHI